MGETAGINWRDERSRSPSQQACVRRITTSTGDTTIRSRSCSPRLRPHCDTTAAPTIGRSSPFTVRSACRARSITLAQRKSNKVRETMFALQRHYRDAGTSPPVALAPIAHAVKNRNKRASAFREHVLHLGWHLRILFPHNKTVRREFLQHDGKGLIRDSLDAAIDCIVTKHATFCEQIEDRHLVFAADERQRVVKSRPRDLRPLRDTAAMFHISHQSHTHQKSRPLSVIQAALLISFQLFLL